MFMSVKNKSLTLLLVASVTAASPVWADAQGAYKKALQHMEKGENAAAQIELKNALKEDPKLIEARLVLGKVYLQNNQYLEAEKELTRVVEANLPADQWAVALSRTYFLLRQFEKLASIPKPADNVEAAHWALYQALAKIGNKQFDQAGQLLQQAKPDAADEALVAFVEGGLAQNADKLDLALSLAQKTTQLDPQKWEYWFFLAGVQQKAQNFASAVASIDKALELSPNNARLHFSRVHLLIKNKQVDEAEKTIDSLLEGPRAHPMAHYFKGIFLAMKGQLNEAKDHYQKVLAVVPNHLPTYFALGSVYFRLNEFYQAEDYLTRYIKEYPNNVEAVRSLAVTKLKLGNLEGALDTLGAVQEAASSDPSYLALYGSLLVRGGDIEKGEKLLKQAVTLAPDASAIRTQLAVAQLATGNREDAITQLESAQEGNQDIFETNVLLVYAHLKNNENQKALAVAQELVKKNDKKANNWNVLGAAYMATKNIDEASKAYLRSLEVEKDNLGALMSLAMVDYSNKDLESAARRLDKVISLRPSHLRALVLRARIQHQQGDKAGAVKLLETAVAKNPKALGAGLTLVNEYIKEERFDQATSLARSLYQNYAKNPLVVSAYAGVMIVREDYGQAKKLLEQWQKLQPDSPLPMHRLAIMYSRKGDFPEAMQAVKQSLNKNKDYLPALAVAAQVALKIKQYDEGLAFIDAIRKQQPDADKIDLWAAQLYIAKGDHKTAESYFKSALKDHDSALTRSLYSKYLIAKNRKEDAVKLLAEWSQKHPEDVAMLAELGLAQQTAAQEDQAIATYKAVVEKSPKNVIVLNNLAWLLAERKDKQSVEYARQALDLVPASPAVMDTLGWALYQTGSVGDAVTMLKEAHMKASHVPEIQYHLAVSLAAAGQKDEAKQLLDKLLEDRSKLFDSRADAEALRKSL